MVRRTYYYGKPYDAIVKEAEENEYYDREKVRLTAQKRESDVKRDRLGPVGWRNIEIRRR